MDTLIQISESNLALLVDKMFARAIPKVVQTTKEELAKLKPSTWIKTTEALRMMDMSRKTLNKLKIEDGDYTPGRIRYQKKNKRMMKWHSGDIKKWKHPEA